MGIRPGERIGILGLARSGIAASRLALSRGASVYASDFSSSDAARAAAETVRALGGVAEIGGHDVDRLAACERIVLSPGIPPSARILQAPELAGIPIIPELEFAYEELAGPVIAITGTNGKTTVTALTAHVLRSAGLNAAEGGNIGIALSELVLRDPQPEVTVVEASSFQLGRTRSFSPNVGVLTNLAPDHLDWYASIEEYYGDKAKMYQNATPESRWVINAEDDEAVALVGDVAGHRFYFRAATPLLGSESGGYLDGEGWLTLRVAGVDRRILPAEDLRILGPHNVSNALAATLAAVMVGADLDGIAEGLRTFSPLNHRLEPVAERRGVLWINDSKATNIASTSVAVRSMRRPTVLLLGGRHKGEEYRKLVPLLRERVKQVVAYGEAAERIQQDLGATVPLTCVAGDFRTVLAAAERFAEPGDAVLLSPACSSYDMFRDYEDRGRQFRDFVLEETE
jgi:UDP-N-acetylmuramoylalanine--D-glutamate ligase